jgi:riboflavin synthase
MFTGIIEEVGEIVAVTDSEDFRRIVVRAPELISDIAAGSSVSTDGVCITARDVKGDTFEADLSGETLARTTLKHAVPGRKVNLELSMRADGRFGGHIVQGHVDGVGRILRFDREGDEWLLQIGYEPSEASRMVWKGSVAVDGISLTVAELEKDTFSIAIIPFTMEMTNLKHRRSGDEVNIEFDVLAKYVERLVGEYLDALNQSEGTN